MKTSVALVLLACLLVSAVMTAPLEGPEGRALRHRRVTCDLLSFSSKIFSFNHSACAAHCLAKRKKGGRCVNGVCRCRN
uniref:Invertebrate defensins family profile domain-containing protein n=1 Tax=Thermobia domestica TaxID=89055 RepID=A4FSG3_THEDO|nr:hypothetical protein [Thermobia domestica]